MPLGLVEAPAVTTGLSSSLFATDGRNALHLGDGRVLIAGAMSTTSDPYSLNTMAIQVLSADYTSASSPIQIASSPSTIDRNGRVTVTELGSGAALVTWTSFNFSSSGSTSEVRYAILNVDATTVSSLQTIMANQGTVNRNLASEALSDGRVVLVWEEYNVSTNTGQYYGQFLDSSGSSSGGKFAIGEQLNWAQNITNLTLPPAVTALDAGSFAVSWQSLEVSPTKIASQIHTQVIGGDGQAMTSEIVANDPLGVAANPISISNGQGGYILFWDNIYSQGNRLEGYVFDASGNKGAAIHVDGFSAGASVYTLQVASLPSGRFVLTWNGGGAGFGYATSFAQVFEEDGKPVTGAFTIFATATSKYEMVNSSNFIVKELPGDKIAVEYVYDNAYHAVFDLNKFIGTYLDDIARGSEANSFLDGNEGNDRLYGNGGDDVLNGGIGDDTLVGGDGADVLDGGEGSDTASYFDAGALNLALDSSFAATGAAFGDALISINNIVGSNTGNDWLRGDAFSNQLTGAGGNDLLEGLTGDDQLTGSAGADILDGGEGVDTADYFEDQAVVLSLKDPSISSGGAIGDTLISIENVVGSNSGDDMIIGDENKNVLYGLGGNDHLEGLGGDDLLVGGGGGDTIDGGEGIDTVYYDDFSDHVISLVNPQAQEGTAAGDTFISIEIFRVRSGYNSFIGNAAANIFYGGDYFNNIDGGAGDDALYGGIGEDTFLGGAGKDLFSGGAGIDIVDYSNGAAVSVSLSGAFANGGAATGDVLKSIENLAGSSKGGDRLMGSSGINVLQGNGGDDILFALGGNDSLFGGTGRDRADFYYSNKAIRVDLGQFGNGSGDSNLNDRLDSIEDLGGSKLGNDILRGDGQDNYITGYGGKDALYGEFGNDLLVGEAGFDSLYGDQGNDELAGGSGNDKLFGGAGDDYLAGGIGADLLDGGTGTDVADYSDDSGSVIRLDTPGLSTGAAKGDVFKSIEVIIGSRTGRDSIYGNAAANILLGNGGNDKLFGNAGSDILAGGKGADRLDGGVGEDIADYFGSTGVTVALDGSIVAKGDAAGDSFVSIEDVAGSNAGMDSIYGNSSKNYLSGNGGADRLNGRGGDDILDGGVGIDVLTGGKGADIFYFESLNGVGDKILDFGQDDYIALQQSLIDNPNNLTFDIEDMRDFFQSGTSNVSNSKLHIFLFRTTDTTFWFDKDGNGTGKPILFADLQTGANLSAQDIFIVA